MPKFRSKKEQVKDEVTIENKEIEENVKTCVFGREYDLEECQSCVNCVLCGGESDNFVIYRDSIEIIRNAAKIMQVCQVSTAKMMYVYNVFDYQDGSECFDIINSAVNVISKRLHRKRRIIATPKDE